MIARPRIFHDECVARLADATMGSAVGYEAGSSPPSSHTTGRTVRYPAVPVYRTEPNLHFRALYRLAFCGHFDIFGTSGTFLQIPHRRGLPCCSTNSSLHQGL
jgi:hypothetical protein